MQECILDNNNTDSKSQGLHSRTGSPLVSPTQNTVPSSPTHQEPVTSTDVVNPRGHLGSGKTVSGTRSDHSGSDTPRSVPGESGSVLKRIKSLLGSPSSKESGDPDQSSGSNGSTKRGQNSRSPKRSSKGKNPGGADSESTPLVSEGRKPQRPAKEKTPGEMAAKDEGGSQFFVWYLSCFATIGGLLFGYDTGEALKLYFIVFFFFFFFSTLCAWNTRANIKLDNLK